jgi:hypothetical protein
MIGLAVLLGLQEPSVLARRCGQEIDWRRTLEEAAAEARALGRPILWYIPQTENSTMDRKDLVDNTMKMGAWMMPAVIDQVRRRFVPVRMIGRGETARRLKIRRVVFAEPGLAILTPDLEPLHLIEGIWTQNEEWLVHLLESVHPDREPPAPDFRRLLAHRREAEARAAARTDLERGLLELKLGNLAAAEPLLKSSNDPEARYSLGAVEFLTGRSDAARRTWTRLAREAPESRWAWKAAAEAEELGPLVRGFEAIPWLPADAYGAPPRSTHVSRPREAAVARGVRWLLQHQRSSGAWEDSTYVFGGLDSVPNVTTAVTALAAAALLEYRSVDPAGVDAALARAWPYLEDERNTAPADYDELIWAHVYRLDALARRQAAAPDPGTVRLMDRIVGLVAAQQGADGSFHHEYPNPFVAASVIVALEQARAAGATVPPEPARRAAAWLAQRRGDDGTFSYGADGAGGAVEGAAGRMPLCELALAIAGRSDTARLQRAVETSRRHHSRLEAVRKFDDHTDAFRNGGFFFWYDLYGRALAASRLDAGPRRAELDSLVRIVLMIGELDGAWVDSHELGKSYGTAMALLVLKTAAK